MRSSASIGVAIAGADDDTPSVLRAADAAMYRAKTHGHAGVYVSERPVEGRRGAAFDPVPYLVDAKDV
jgi:GGDEF domain-containing protein